LSTCTEHELTALALPPAVGTASVFAPYWYWEYLLEPLLVVVSSNAYALEAEKPAMLPLANSPVSSSL
jgi:hypothetical protein